MADQYPMKPVPGRPVGTPAPAPIPHRPPRFPDDPDAARAEIAATRARMSNTIDELEGALLRKKEEIRDRLDVMEPVREQPLRSLGIIFGAALAFGFLTGGGGKRKETEIRYLVANGASEDDGMDEEIEDEGDDEAELAWERAELWEDRAHRLLRIAQAQESELELHRSRRDQLRDRLRSLRRAEAASEQEDDDHEDEDEGSNLFDRVKINAASRLASIADDVSHRFMRGA